MGLPDPEMAPPEPIPEELSNSLLQNTRCCFCFPCFSSRRSSTVGVAWWQRIGSSSTSSHGSVDDLQHHNHWWDRGIRALKKLREWSEIVAGPKWKTFIRRFNRNHHPHKGGGSGNGRLGKFQYDPLSYALNFDEGQSGDFEEGDDYASFRNFSSRFSSFPASGRSLTVEKDVAVVA